MEEERKSNYQIGNSENAREGGGDIIAHAPLMSSFPRKATTIEPTPFFALEKKEERDKALQPPLSRQRRWFFDMSTNVRVRTWT